MENININGLIDLFMEIFAYIEKVLAALESKFVFETWYEDKQNAENSQVSE